jgi:hypothetical protein
MVGTRRSATLVDAEATVGAESSGERATDNLIRDPDTKLRLALDAEYVLVRHQGGSSAGGDVDLQLGLTVWAFNHHHNEGRLVCYTFRHGFSVCPINELVTLVD